jgi:hypothetical protein
MQDFRLTLTLVHQWTDNWNNALSLVYVPANGGKTFEWGETIECKLPPINRYTVEETSNLAGRSYTKGESVCVFSKAQIWGVCPKGFTPAVGQWEDDFFTVEEFISPL